MGRSVKYEAVVIGVSAGGLTALSTLFSGLPENYPLPIMIVQHRSKDERDLLENVLQQKHSIKIKQADEKEGIKGGFIYIAPANYHLLVESNKTFSLSADEKVRYSRPSIDVLFESAAEVYKETLVGIILTGSNDDGANGMKCISSHNGLTISQNPAEAQFPVMPAASIRTGAVKRILLLKEIQQFLLQLSKNGRHEEL